MAEPGVTVIVPVYNGERTLPALYSALGSQKSHALGETEIIVVDNGSTDQTRRITDAADIKGLRTVDEPRRGPPAARNRGIAEARGAVLAFLDADCVPTRAWLKELVAPFIDPEVIICAGGLASFPPKTAAQRFAARYGLNEAQRNLQARGIPFANTRNMAVRRSAAQVVGGFPVDLTPGEEVEFSHRIRQRFGCEILYRPAALVFHQDRATDVELFNQAHGYGRGTGRLYALHPELLQFRWRHRLIRARRTGQRRLALASARLRTLLGKGNGEEREFADYLVKWDREFWLGFEEGRRIGKASE